MRGSHADINADSVIDHVHAVGRQAGGRAGAERLGKRVAACYAFVSTGIPTTGDLFNGTICNPGGSSFTRGGGEQDDSPLSMEQIDAMFEGSVDSEVLDQTAPAMEVVTPVLIRSYGVRGGSGGAVNRATGAAFSWDSVFLTSDGHVTSYGADGRRQWVSATPASWRPSDNRLDSDGTASLNVGAQTLDVDASVLPTLAVFSPVPHEEGGFVLAADSQQLAILTSDGEVQHTIALPDFPTAPVNVGMDFGLGQTQRCHCVRSGSRAVPGCAIGCVFLPVHRQPCFWQGQTR